MNASTLGRYVFWIRMSDGPKDTLRSSKLGTDLTPQCMWRWVDGRTANINDSFGRSLNCPKFLLVGPITFGNSIDVYGWCVCHLPQHCRHNNDNQFNFSSATRTTLVSKLFQSKKIKHFRSAVGDGVPCCVDSFRLLLSTTLLTHRTFCSIITVVGARLKRICSFRQKSNATTNFVIKITFVQMGVRNGKQSLVNLI